MKIIIQNLVFLLTALSSGLTLAGPGPMRGGVSDGGGCLIVEGDSLVPIELAQQNKQLIIDQNIAGATYEPSKSSFITGFSYFNKIDSSPYQKAIEILEARYLNQNSLVAKYWLQILKDLDFIYSPYALNAQKYNDLDLLSCPQDHLVGPVQIELAMYFVAPETLNIGMASINLPVFNSLSFAHQVAEFLHESARELKNIYKESLTDESIYELVRSTMILDRQNENLDDVLLKTIAGPSRFTRLVSSQPRLEPFLSNWCGKYKKPLGISDELCRVNPGDQLQDKIYALERALATNVRELDLKNWLESAEGESKQRDSQYIKERKLYTEARGEVHNLNITRAYWNLEALDESPMVSRLVGKMNHINGDLDHYLKTYNGRTGEMRISFFEFLKGVEFDDLPSEYKQIKLNMCKELRNGLLASEWFQVSSNQSKPACPYGLLERFFGINDPSD